MLSVGIWQEHNNDIVFKFWAKNMKIPFCWQARSSYNAAYRRGNGFDRKNCVKNDLLPLTLWTNFLYPDCQTSKKRDSCCGQTPYDSSKHLCCAGKLRRLDSQKVCCGQKVIDRTKFGCCNEKSFDLRWVEVSSSILRIVVSEKVKLAHSTRRPKATVQTFSDEHFSMTTYPRKKCNKLSRIWNFWKSMSRNSGRKMYDRKFKIY